MLNFDSRKIKIDRRRGVVKKQSSFFEYQQLKIAIDYLESCPIILDCGIQIRAISIVDWIVNELSTKFCRGLNLEHALRYGSNKNFWAKVCKQLLKAFQERGFLWGDIAPRNMIFDKLSSSIYIFDFERPLIIKDCSVGKSLFAGFFRRYAYEEFSCILTVVNQRLLFTNLLSENNSCEFFVDNLKSKRKKHLLKQYFGQKKSYTVKELHIIEDLMSAIATPFSVSGGTIIYPMFLIEKAVKEGGVYAYAKIVRQLKKCSTEAEKLFVLQNIMEGF
ncbi:MAG: hypothetical protein V1825_04085 [Candidatus Falkowbacteria bacterium]